MRKKYRLFSRVVQQSVCLRLNLLRKWQFILVLPESSCLGALGMEAGIITNRAIKSSSVLGHKNLARYGRLNMVEKPGVHFGTWIPKYNDTHQWLQIDLGSVHFISKIATQGSPGAEQWVTSYALNYSLDGVTFDEYRNNDKKTVIVEFIPHRDKCIINTLFTRAN